MTEPAGLPPHAIAIVGLAGRFPDARDLDEFWRNVRDGVESLQAFSDADLEAAGVAPALRADPRYVRKGTVLEAAEGFDAAFFGMSPREAQIVDPQQRLFLECAWEAMENAGVVPGDPARSVGVYAGTGMNTYLLTQVLRDPALVESVGGYQLMLGNDKDFLCTRVSYKLDLHGPGMTIQTACSTSLVATVVASRALQRGECDVALAGGVSVPFPQRAGYLHQEGMILSPDGHCRPFDRSAGGIRPGAGCGVVVLKRLADALADRDTIRAVIRGAAINNDGGGKAGYTAPGVDGQVEVIATAQLLAGVAPRSIGYLEAHGTATPLGDPIEIAALTQVFRASTPDVGFCRLGSLKANLGHLDAAAGVASLIKAVLAIENRAFPPLVNFEAPNPQLALDSSPFLASATGAPWPAGETPRRAGVSSFGIGGTNAHVVIEEAPATPVAATARGPQLLVISARTEAALAQASSRLSAHLAAHPGQPLADVAWTLQCGRKAFAHRRFVVAGGGAQAIEGLADANPAHAGRHEGGARAVAFLFSGQGSQHAGMGASLYAGERVFRECVDRCAALLRPHLGLDLREAMFAARDDTAIHETRLAQPALFVMEVALAALWAQWGVKPAAMIGHSIGEYVAAHLAGVMSLEDALAIVAARGRLMQSLPPGRMAAVHLGAGALERELAGSGVEIAAANAPDLCTISGPAQALSAALARLEAKGIETRALHTSHAFHSAMMEPVLAPFTDLLAGMRLAAPTLPYVSNVTGTWITAAQATSPDYYARHLRGTVRFEAGLRTLAAEPALQLLEVGPGTALASLARPCVGRDGARRVLASLGHASSERPAVECLLEAAGRLWLAGVPIDGAGLHADGAPRRVPLPSYPFERQRHAVDAPARARGPAAEPAATDIARDVDATNLHFAPTWIRSDARAGTPARLAGAWLVLGGPDALADAVAGQVASAGGRAIRVAAAADFAREAPGRYRARPGVPGDIAAIASDVRGTGESPAGAIMLWSLPDDDAGPGERVNRLYHAPVAIAEGLGVTRRSPARLVVATVGAQSVLDEPVRRPGAALALGPVLVLPTEVPGLDACAIDLAPPGSTGGIAEAAAALVAEAAAGDGESIVAIRAGRRWLRRFERLAPGVAIDSPGLFKSRGVYLVTGGLGGMGLALAHELAASVAARLLLVGRSGLPPRERWDEVLAQPGTAVPAAAIRAIRAIESAGGEVLVAAADAADPAAMRRAIDDARARWGAIDGVIHAAGVAGAGRLAFLKTRDDVDAVLSPKAGGLDVLVQLLGDSPLDFVALMGSINAVVGAPGVADYAAANAMLDSYAESAQRPAAWKRVVALDWSAWREVGMAANLAVPAERREAWLAYLREGISTAAGIDSFKRALACGLPRLVVVPPALAPWLEGRRPRPAGAAAAGEGHGQEPPVVSEALSGGRDTGAGSSESPVEQQLTAIWTELLGVDSIGWDDDFFELGGHSLAATRALARIESTLGVRLALRDIFDAPTVRRLAARIAESSPGAARSGGAGAGDDREEIEF